MNIMYILAHPDDAEIWCGGTILRQLERGDRVRVLYLYATNDRRQEALLLTKNGVEVEFARPKPNNVRRRIREFKPNVIVTHWFKDCHHEHKSCFENLYSILPELLVFDGVKFSLYVCDTYNSVGFDNSTFKPSKYVDVTKYITDKKNLIRRHVSQPADYFIGMVEKQNVAWGNEDNCKYAEAFLQLPLQGIIYEYEL